MKPYYSDSGITIWHGNCLDVLPTLDRVDHVITDPPYEAEAHTKGRRVKRTHGEPLDKWAWRDKRGVVRYESLDFPALDANVRARTAAFFARLGRKAIGIEINEAYCEIAAKRLAQGALPLEFSA